MRAVTADLLSTRVTKCGISHPATRQIRLDLCGSDADRPLLHARVVESLPAGPAEEEGKNANKTTSRLFRSGVPVDLQMEERTRDGEGGGFREGEGLLRVRGQSFQRDFPLVY